MIDEGIDVLWVAKQRITQTFSPNLEIFFPPLGEDEGAKGPMIIEVEIGGHRVHRIWRMCVDFKDLNKACPKDGYPLPEIDWKVESLCGLPFKCFLDTYKGYHQIQMAKKDEEKTAFITIQGIFCNTKMPFGLRNAGATYQHLTTEAEEAFKQMKQLIAELPMLMAPMEKEELIVYLAAAKETILSRPKVAGRLQKWSIELGEYAIHYRPRVSVKGQILADFIFERPEEDSPDTPMEEEEKLPKSWILFTDGSYCTDGSRAGVILTNLEGMEFTYALISGLMQQTTKQNMKL
uniref:Reverse transcriptase domain-containing protein n=1 Tax=Tanacetum cinerariifolium TaxID=118510 RepID=A0A6L2JPR3_TANCI|nr:reverse transcriptase domain-containing protein [Tanacetum cinerariifolium]